MLYDRINVMLQINTSILGKSKQKVLGSDIIMSLLSPIIVMIWPNYCKYFWWFYCVNGKDIAFVWFRFLVCIDYFQHLFMITILEVWLIVCLELRFSIIFVLIILLLLLAWLLHKTLIFSKTYNLLMVIFCHLLVVAWMINQQILFHV